MEARLLMMATNNIFSPSSRQTDYHTDAGHHARCYYLTAEPRTPMPPTRGNCRWFGSKDEVIFAYDDGAVEDHDRIRLANPDFGRQTVYGDPAGRLIETTVGRVTFSEIWPSELAFTTKPPARATRRFDLEMLQGRRSRQTVAMLAVKELGFREATKSGASFGIGRHDRAKERRPEIDDRRKSNQGVEKQIAKGVITRRGEPTKNRGHLDALDRPDWPVSCSAPRTEPGQEGVQPGFSHGGSGARGNKQQFRSSAVRGTVSWPEAAARSSEKRFSANFVSVNFGAGKYFNSRRPRRANLGRYRLSKTADPVTLTRKLVDVSQDVIIQEPDCGTTTHLGSGGL